MNSKYFDDRMIMLKKNISKSICMEANGLGSDTAAPIDANKGNKTLAPIKYKSADDLKKDVAKGIKKATETKKPKDQVKVTKGLIDQLKGVIIQYTKSGIKKVKEFALKIATYVKKIWKFLMNGFANHVHGTGVKLAMIGFMILALLLIIVGGSGAADAIRKAGTSFLTAMKDVFSALMSGIASLGKAALSLDLTKFGQEVINVVMNVIAAPFAIVGSALQAIVDSGNAALLTFGISIISIGIGFEIILWQKYENGPTEDELAAAEGATQEEEDA